MMFTVILIIGSLVWQMIGASEVLFWLLVWYKFRKEQEVQNVESICTISPVFLSAFDQQWTHTHTESVMELLFLVGKDNTITVELGDKVNI